ncbi:MAG: NTP transferase domain-containing protein [Desulfarculus sp.]|nr:NTP transferase domain-containing protein [Desulfarculus sp.]
MQPQDKTSRHLAPETMPGQVAAVILAAGLSSRMGRCKPLLPLGGATVLERAVGMFKAAGVAEVVVVTGHRAGDLGPLIAGLGARPIFNPGYEQGMFSSVLAGAAALGQGAGAFFLLPADMPLVRPATLLHLAQAWEASGAELAHPSFLGQRGHPPLISTRLLPGLMAWPGQGGLRGYLESLAGPSLLVEVPDQGVLRDMDHPQDYEEMQVRWQRRQVPGPQEVLALLGPVLGVEQKVRAHCRAVATVALALGQALKDAGQPLDLELLEAAALVHDLAKGQPQHAQAGGRLLRRWGWGPVARAVETHMDIEVPSGGPLGEAELLYLADKLVEGATLVGLEERFAAKLTRHGADPVLAQAIGRRWHNATAIQARLEQASGRALADILAPLGATARQHTI